MEHASEVRAILEALHDGDREFLAADASGPWAPALRGLVEGPDPQDAITRALGLPDPVLAAGPLPDPLVRLLHQGRYPARLLTILPAAIDVLQGPARPTPGTADLLAQIEARAAAADIETAIGEVRTREYLRLARAECEGAPLEEVGSGLSRLAAACCEAALRSVDLQHEVCVMGMGKLGGFELNFLSDIDLVFVHDDELEEGEHGRSRLVRTRDRLRTVVRLLEGAGRFRPVFRVDLRLRPFGTQGPLSMSVSAAEAYYAKHGRPWERQAWVRARPLAGAEALGTLLLRRLTPFVYRRSVSITIFEEIAELMELARRGRPPEEGNVNLKLDPGGIREVEFTVQALQLLHGGKRPALRTTSTLEALHRMLAAGLVSDREHADLTEAYREFRRIEHRLQLSEGVQTHTIEGDETARRRLAGRLGITDAAGMPSAEALAERVDVLRQRVSAIARTVGGDGTLASPRDRAREVALDWGASPAARHQALRTLGLADPEEADAQISHAASRTDGPLRGQGLAAEGARRLLAACLDASDPDASVTRFVEFAARRPAHYAIWRFLASPPAPELVQLVAELFGANEPLSRGLVGFPGKPGAAPDESIELLLSAGATTLPGRVEHAEAMQEHPFSDQPVHVAVRRFKHQQLVRIALFDLGHRPPAEDVGCSLSQLADLMIRTVVRDLAAHTALTRPAAHGLSIAVFGLGKLGMESMDYGSDVDLMLVYEHPPGSDGAAEARRFGQSLIARLQDRVDGMRLYEVDMRLRPSGKQGLLVSSREAFGRYHAAALPIWEKLAVLRTRPVAEVHIDPRSCAPTPASDPQGVQMASALPGPLCEAAAADVAAGLSSTSESEGARVAERVRDLKARIEREIAREFRTRRQDEGTHLHIKAGVGGILEAELLVGALQLRHADRPGILQRSLPAALSALVACAALDAREARAIRAAYGFQRTLLNRLRMTQRAGLHDPDRIAENSPRLATLARRMGLPDRDELLDRLAEARRTVRDSFDRHLAGHAGTSRPPTPTQ